MQLARGTLRAQTRPHTQRWALAALTALALACHKNDKDGVDTSAPPDPVPVEITDVLPQQLTTPIDILIVLDGSWSEGIDNLTREVLDSGFETLLLADPSWRIGILNAAASGTSFGLIGMKFDTWPYPSNAFQVGGSGPPKIRQSVYTALELRKEQAQNKEFLRPEAHLYILVFTDATDATDGDSEGISLEEFDRWLDDFSPSNSRRLGALTTSQRGDYWREHTYNGGAVYEVGSFPKGLQSMFRDAIHQRTSFTLNYTPTEPPELVQVVFREHKTEYLIEQDYTYDDLTNTISFLEVVPAPDSAIHVTYETLDDVNTTETPTDTTPTDL